MPEGVKKYCRFSVNNKKLATNGDRYFGEEKQGKQLIFFRYSHLGDNSDNKSKLAQ